jgi:hypothetical protein
LAAPTPIIEDDTTCVVLTGAPNKLAPQIMAEAVKSAAKPLIGSILKIFPPIVRIIFQPPNAVPEAIDIAQRALTQMGTEKLPINPPLTRAMVMIPIDFWASLEPWAKEAVQAESICSLRKLLLTRAGDDPEKIQNKMIITILPIIRPKMGERIRPAKILVKPYHLTWCIPKEPITEPVRPPIKAWDELLGMPKYQVKRFQNIALIRAAIIMLGVTISGATISLPIVAATAVPLKAPKKFKQAAMRIAVLGESALVEIDVAIALAVSWKPLM